MAIVKKKVNTKFYTTPKEVGANDKCPPQAKLILDTIKAAGGRVSREDLMNLLKRPVEQGGLKTTQTAERILGFYKPKLTELGVLKEETETTEIDVEVPDKPAPAEKAAGAADAAAATGGQSAPAADKTKGKKGEHKAA